jgi:hypothetical protein
MTAIAEALKREDSYKKEYLQNELKSLHIEPDHLQNELMVKPVDSKDGHKRTSSHYLTFVQTPPLVCYGLLLFKNKRYFRILENISEWLLSVAVKQNRPWYS